MAIAETSSGMLNVSIPSVCLFLNEIFPTNRHGSLACSHEIADFREETILLSAPFDPDARGSCLLDRKALPLEFKIEDEADTMDGTTQMETDFGHLDDFLVCNGVKLMLASFNLYTSLNIVKEAFAVKARVPFIRCNGVFR